ncbi:hypothetical protein BX666DRAFT_1461591 [Dichotomocladium elegans]|nr:hypothetical protein BX666DRAFT_1461591 [Dichotomocladium elegans]
MSETDIKVLRCHIDDFDKLYDHFRMLTDFFGVQRQTIYQIITLRLMLKLNNGLRKAADQVSASIIISTRIGRLYDELGYSGKAANEFAIAKSAIEQMVCSNEAEVYYIIFYALHLAKLGDLERSKNIFNSAQIVWQSIKEARANDKLDHTRRKISQKLILADAHLVMSFLSALMQSSLDDAIRSCEKTLEILSSCNTSLKLEREDREAVPNIVEDPFQADMTNDQTGKEEQEEAIVMSHITCEESEWAIAEKVDACLMHLSQLYMANGSAKHAQYYMQKGQMLSEKLRSRTTKFLYLLAMSDLNLRCARPETSKANVKLASEIKPSGSFHLLEDALLSMAIGDVDAFQGCIEEASQAYVNAETLLSEMRDRNVIRNVERLIEPDDTSDSMDTHNSSSTAYGQDDRSE